MDFNRAFYAYDLLEGSHCQTALPVKMTQQEAAAEAVKQIGLRQKKEVDMRLFGEQKEWAEMFMRRLALVKRYQ